MKKSRYSDSQILAILKQNEQGVSYPELCREHGMSSAQFYKWRSKYGGKVKFAPSIARKPAELKGMNTIALQNKPEASYFT